MDTQATLSVVAEIGIGVAGFSSIATAVLARSSAGDLEARWIQMRILLVTGLAIVILAYVPMVLSASALGEKTIWTIASAIYAGWVFLVLAISLRGYRILAAKRGGHRLLANLMIALALGGVGFNIANVAHFRSEWPYLAALGCGLIVTFSQLISLVRSFWDISDTPMDCPRPPGEYYADKSDSGTQQKLHNDAGSSTCDEGRI